METILGLLLVLLPLVFKLVEKRLQAAGDKEKAGKIRDLSEKIFGDGHDDADLTGEEHHGQAPVFHAGTPDFHAEIPVMEAIMDDLPEMPSRPEPFKTTPVRPLVEKEGKEKETNLKGKIDPKKLVIYSEIMKPKF